VHTSVNAVQSLHAVLLSPRWYAAMLLWSPYGIGQTIIFSCCYLCFFLLSCFSSPNLSRRRLNVYHTCTQGVAIVRILDAGLKRAACGSLETQDAKKVAKNRYLRTIAQSDYIFATKARINNRKKTC